MPRLLQSRTLQLVVTRGVYLVSWFLLLAFLVQRLEALPHDNDRLVLGFLWMQLSLVILDFGTGEFFTRRIALGMAPAAAVRNGIRARLVVLAVLAVVAVPLVGSLYPEASARLVIGLALVAAAVRSLNEFAESILVALGKTTQVFRFALAQGGATLAGGWVAATWGGSSPVPVIFGLLTLVYVVLGAWRFRSLVGPAVGAGLSVGEVLRGCLPFAGMSIAAALTVSAPGLLLSVWASPTRDLKSFNGASRLWVAALPRCESLLLILFGILPMTVSALVPGAWLPASHAEHLKTLLVAALTAVTWIALPLLGSQSPDHLLVAMFGVLWFVQSMLMWRIAGRRGLPSPGLVGVSGIPILALAACWSHLGASEGIRLTLSLVLLASLVHPLWALLKHPPARPVT